MLSEALAGTYRRYKEDTNSVAAWLASTAKACDYPGELLVSKSWNQQSPQSGRLKGRARKEAKIAASKDKKGGNKASMTETKTSKYIVAIKDFVPLAEFIASHSSKQQHGIVIPDTLFPTLSRVITARTAFSARLQERAMESNVALDESHNYFVGILEAVRDALRPLVTPATTVPSTKQNSAEPKLEAALANKFAILQVDEPSEAFLSALNIERPKPCDHDAVTYEAEHEASEEDSNLAFYALIEDITTIRNRITWIWYQERGGGLDLAAAAVATNSAIELARGMMDEIQSTFGFSSATIVDNMIRRHKHHCKEAGLKEEGYDFNYTYDLASNFYLVAYFALKAFPTASIEKGTVGLKDVTSGRDTKTGKDKFLEDQGLLAEFLAELSVVIRLVPKYPRTDELLSFHETLNVPSWPASNDKPLREFKALVEWIIDDPVYEGKMKHLTREGQLSEPMMERHRIHKSSPVLSGLVLFYASTRYRDISLAVCNGWAAFVGVAHLHNALEQEKLLVKPLLFVEWAFNFIDDADIWVGGQRPRAPDEYCKRFLVQSGVKPSAFANCNKSRKQSAFLSKAKPRGIKKGVLVSSMFAPSYVYGRPTIVYSPEQVQCIINQGESRLEVSVDETGMEMVGAVKKDAEELKKQTQAKGKTPRVQTTDISNQKLTTTHGRARPDPAWLIMSLVFALHYESFDVRFSYLRIHHWSLLSLHRVHKECSPTLVKLFAPKYTGAESQLPSMVGFILRAASGDGDNRRDMRPLKETAAAFKELANEELRGVLISTLDSMIRSARF